MKIQHIYTVTRTFEIPDEELKNETQGFLGVKDEVSEYLY